MTTLIGGKTCRTCAHRRTAQAAVFCYRYPPTVLLMPGVDPVTRQPVWTLQTVFPQVNPEMPCGEYARSEVFAREELATVAPGEVAQ